MKHHILVTGGAGYIGSVLTGLALEAGHRVTVLDRFFFGDTLAHLRGRPGLRAVRGDTRAPPLGILKGITAVLDLAALSNDPAGELDPATTLAINHRARARMAAAAKDAGVGRYVLASSCSVYGFQDGWVDEASATNPLTTYATANLLAEQACLPLASEGFTPTALRQATVYGQSPRMRYDLAVNAMALAIAQTGRVRLMRDGTQWRPFVHVRDTSRAFLATLEAPADRIAGTVLNIGSDDQNLQLETLARKVAAGCGVPAAHDWYGDADSRSYRVRFAKARRLLGLEPDWSPRRGAAEVHAALVGGRSAATPATRTVEWYKHLVATRPAEVLADGPLL